MRDLDACVVASTYCNSWVFPDFDPAEPFESTARAYTRLFIARSDEEKEKVLLKLLKDFSINGVIYHEAKTCPNNSNTLYGLPQRLSTKSGLPFVIIYGDLNDLGCYSQQKAQTQIEAFIETLDRER
jgi:benzoyl-CoA reductase/2-hydroxyglutaryl-CoA dehydratase subunit BcrC/BadD/HgdB